MMVSFFKKLRAYSFFLTRKKDCYHDRFGRSYHDF